MLGTSEERRYMGPAGSQTQHHHNSQPIHNSHNNSSQLASAVPHLSSHPATAAAAFPSFYSPYSHFQHLAALHTSFGGSNLSTTDLILNQTSAHTSSLWPGSPTLSSTTNGHLPQTPSNAACGGRLSAFDFYTNGQGEFFILFPVFFLSFHLITLDVIWYKLSLWEMDRVWNSLRLLIFDNSRPEPEITIFGRLQLWNRYRK